MTAPRIYRACLACYNSGNLVGEWLDASDTDAITAWEEAHQTKTGHEEFAIHDYDSMVDLGEYPSLDDVAEWAAVVEEHGHDVVNAFVSMVGSDYAKPDDFADAYRGTWKNEEDFAEQLADVLGLFADVQSDSPLRMYFDYEAFARDLFMGDYYSADIPDGVAVFDRNF